MNTHRRKEGEERQNGGLTCLNVDTVFVMYVVFVELIARTITNPLQVGTGRHVDNQMNPLLSVIRCIYA